MFHISPYDDDKKIQIEHDEFYQKSILIVHVEI